MSEYLNILSAIMRVDNAERNAAEARLSQLTETDAASSALALMEIMGSTNEISLRSLAGILLRRTLDKCSERISAEQTAFIRRQLLTLWNVEVNPILLKRLSHILAQSASNGDWKDLCPSLIASHNNANSTPAEVNKTTALLGLVEVLTEYAPDDIQDNLGTVGGLLVTCLNGQPAKVEVACAKATCACVAVMRDDAARNNFKSAISSILRICSDALNRGDEVDTTLIIEYLVEVASIQPLFFKANLDDIVGAMLVIANSEPLDFATRSIALEFLCTMCEAAPVLCRRCTPLTNGIIPCLFSIIFEQSAEVEERDWVQGPYSDDSSADAPEESDSADTIGEEAVERLAASLGGKVLGTSLLAAVTQLQGSPDPIHRRAAMVVLVRFAEGCASLLIKTKQVSGVFGLLAKGIADANPRVQYQACQGIGRFAILFPDQVSDLLVMFLPPIVGILADPATTGSTAVVPCQKVKGHAASALINMVNPTAVPPHSSVTDDPSEPESVALVAVKSHLQPLVHALVYSLQTCSVQVQSPCLVVLGCIAQVVEDGFVPFYDVIIPGIKNILQSNKDISSDQPSGNNKGKGAAMSLGGNSSTYQQQQMHTARVTLYGKAMECVGLIGEAVGNEIFARDALEIIQFLVAAMDVPGRGGLGSGNDTITFDYILPACARIAKALGNHFEPFIPLVVGPLLVGANVDIQFTMQDLAEEEEDEAVNTVTHDEDTNIDSTIINIGGGIKKKITLNTHAVQQKQQAARLIYEYAGALKGYMHHYLQPCLKVILDFICDRHSSEIRSASSLAVKPLLEGFVHAFKKLNTATAAEVQGVFDLAVSRLLVAIHGENNPESRACAVEALRDTLACVYESGIQGPFGYRTGLCCHMANPTPIADAAIASTGQQQQQSPVSVSVCESVLQECLQQCQESILRIQTKEAAMTGGDKAEVFDRDEGDMDEAQEALEEELDVLTNITDIFGQVLKISTSANNGGHAQDRQMITLYLEKFIVPAYLPYLFAANNGPSSVQTSLRVMATCLVDDILEFVALNSTGDAAAAVAGIPSVKSNFNQIVQALLTNCGSDHLLLKQCSSYGLVQLLQHHGWFIAQNEADTLLVSNILPVIMTILQHPEAKSEDCEGITENAVYSLGLAVTNYSGAVLGHPEAALQFKSLVSMFLQSLPLTADETEFHGSSALLGQLLEKMDNNVLGDNYANVPAILKVVSQLLFNHQAAMAKQVVTPTTNVLLLEPETCTVLLQCNYSRLTAVLSQYAKLVPAHVMQAAVATLPVPHQQVLSTA